MARQYRVQARHYGEPWKTLTYASTLERAVALAEKEARARGPFTDLQGRSLPRWAQVRVMFGSGVVFAANTEKEATP